MIYLDHAATTAVDPGVFAAMTPWLTSSCGNPSSAYDYGYDARAAITRAREQTAALISASPDRIFFTSGGTEADNWVLCSTARMSASKGRHIISTNMEHHAILHTLDYLEENGFEVTRLPVSEDGFVTPKQLEEAIRPDTILVSVMFANNEIGTIQPIRALSAVAHRHGIRFHTDAVQAFGQIPIDVAELGIDMLSASSHKLYGPKGCGCLYVREGIDLPPRLFGGAQENGMRAGTENVPGIVGFGAAAAIAMEQMTETMEKETKLRDFLITQVLRRIPYARLNGSHKNRLPGNANFSFQFVEGSTLLIMLDMKGICASTGSACTASSSSPSHVLRAIGLPDDLARGSLRLTLGRNTTEEEIHIVVDALEEILENLRSVSEDYNRIILRR